MIRLRLASLLLVLGLLAGGAALLAPLSPARAGDAGDPAAARSEAEAAARFLKRMSRSAIDELGDTSVPEAERRAAFRALLTTHFDMANLSRFVLGRYWRTADESERAAFRKAFIDMSTARFLPMFESAKANGTDLRILKARPAPDMQRLFHVETKVQLPDYDNVTMRVTWHLRRESPGPEGFRVADVRSEGVSMAIMLRAEYASVLQRHGGDISVLIDRMDRIAQR